MRKLLLLLLIFGCSNAHVKNAPEETDTNSKKWVVTDDRLPIADPYVLHWQGKYYAYGTRVQGFEVYTSTDLEHWRRGSQLALSPTDSWGTRWFWAPEVYYVDSKKKFYMFYSVDEHICVATSDSPEGPFRQAVKQPIVPDEKGIDTTLFIDDDGTPYLFYVRFTAGNVIWVARMNDDLQSIQANTLKQCISATEPWEQVQARVAEGPSIMKHNGTYYLLYSANDYQSLDYAVGYATASSPFGPWTKYSGNPILSRKLEPFASAGLVGTGHGAPFQCDDGSYRYIFHAHWNKEKVQPRTSYIADLTFDKAGGMHIGGTLIKPMVVK